MAKKFALTDAAAQLAAQPPSDCEPCEGPCPFVLIQVTDRCRVWRCATCLRYIAAPVLPENERNYRNRLAHPRAEPFDQESLLDRIS